MENKKLDENQIKGLENEYALYACAFVDNDETAINLLTKYIMKHRREGQSDIDDIIIYFLSDIISLLDSCKLLIKEGRITTVAILVRTLLEVMFQVLFLMDGNDAKENMKKVACYNVFSLCKLYNFLYLEKRSRKLTPEENTLYLRLKHEHDDAKDSYVREKIKKMDDSLKKHYINYWYTLHDEKIKNISGLAKYLGGEILYDAIYNSLSRFVHGEEGWRNIIKEKNTLAIRPFKNFSSSFSVLKMINDIVGRVLNKGQVVYSVNNIYTPNFREQQKNIYEKIKEIDGKVYRTR